MSRGLLLFLGCLLVVLATVAVGVVRAGNFSAVPGTGFFIDHSNGGVRRLMRGTNMVQKAPGAWQVTQQQLALMKRLGLNVVRYGVIWINVEIAPGVYNMTYLKDVRAQIELLYAHGIYAFLDMHQDLLSPFFCSGVDGAPTFYVHPPNSTDYFKNGPKAYPEPFARPSYLPDPTGAFGPWGMPACDSLSQWAEGYPTFASSATWQAFYNNANGVHQRYAAMWAAVAEAVGRNNPAVVGYEIINEPWIGDVWSDPLLLLGGVADKANLMPLYDAVQKALRAVTPEVPVFFEPITGGSFLDGTIGFTADTVPGGRAWAHRDVYAFHLYCPLIQVDVHLNKTSPIIRVVELALCNVFDQLNLDNRGAQAAAIGTGSFLTEFGSIPYTEAAANMMHKLTEFADANRMSWTFWEMGLLSGAPAYVQNAIAKSYPAVAPGRVFSFASRINATIGGQLVNTFRCEYAVEVTGGAVMQLSRAEFPLTSPATTFTVFPSAATAQVSINAELNQLSIPSGAWAQQGQPVVVEVRHQL